jgi:hypothetical protein
MLSAVCHRGRAGWEGFLRRACAAGGADAATAAAEAPAAVEERSGGVGEAGCGRVSRRRTGRFRGAAAAGGREAMGMASRASGEEAGPVAAAAREGDAMGRGGGGGGGGSWGWGGGGHQMRMAGEILGKPKRGEGEDEHERCRIETALAASPVALCPVPVPSCPLRLGVTDAVGTPMGPPNKVSFPFSGGFVACSRRFPCQCSKNELPSGSFIFLLGSSDLPFHLFVVTVCKC